MPVLAASVSCSLEEAAEECVCVWQLNVDGCIWIARGGREGDGCIWIGRGGGKGEGGRERA